MGKAVRLDLILHAIADVDQAIASTELAQIGHTTSEVVEALLAALIPFGAVQRDGAGRYYPTHNNTRPFLRCFAISIAGNIVLVDDWERRGAECSDGTQLFDRGVCVLSAMEHKRVDAGSKEPTRIIPVSKAIIRRDKGAEPYFLFMLNPASGKFQLIGGKARGGESPETTLFREINEEITTVNLKNDRDYSISLATTTGMDFISPTVGAYTHYDVSYFFVHLRREISITPNQRWISLAEVSQGRTADGFDFIPTPEASPGFVAMLRQAPASGILSEATESVQISPSPHMQSGTIFAPLLAACALIAVISLSIWVISISGIFDPKAAGIVITAVILTFVFVALLTGHINGEQFSNLISRVIPGASEPRAKPPRRRK